MKLTVQHTRNHTSFTSHLQAPGGTIGRGSQNDIDLPDDSGDISTLQAVLRMDERRGTATLLNMSSMGRVAVNDAMLALSQETLVAAGDRIAVGDYLITVEQPVASAPSNEKLSLNASPYDTSAFGATTAATGAAFAGAASPGFRAAAEPAEQEALPSYHPAYQPPTPASPSADATHPLGTPQAYEAPAPAATPKTTVAPMPGESYAPAAENAAPEPEPPAPEENPDDIFKDLLSGPGVLPVGGDSSDGRHPFDMESATNRNHHNPVELLKPEGLHHPTIDGDPLDALPTDGAEKDRSTIFSDDSPTTLSKDSALDSHKEDNILETLRRSVHAGYKDKGKPEQ